MIDKHEYSESGTFSQFGFCSNGSESTGAGGGCGCGFPLFVLFVLFLIGSFIVWAIA